MVQKTILHNYVHLPQVADHDDQNDKFIISRGRTTLIWVPTYTYTGAIIWGDSE